MVIYKTHFRNANKKILSETSKTFGNLPHIYFVLFVFRSALCGQKQVTKATKDHEVHEDALQKKLEKLMKVPELLSRIVGVQECDATKV